MYWRCTQIVLLPNLFVVQLAIWPDVRVFIKSIRSSFVRLAIRVSCLTMQNEMVRICEPDHQYNFTIYGFYGTM